MILAAHAFLAQATGQDCLAITKDEATSLAEATNKVLRHYDIKMTQKALDHYALLMTAGGIYAPRLALLAMAKKSSPKPQTASSPLNNDNVMPMKPPVTNGSGFPIA